MLPPPSLSSILTIKPSPDPNDTPDNVFPATPPSEPQSTSGSGLSSVINGHTVTYTNDPLGTESLMSIATLDTYHTAVTESTVSSTYATEGGSTITSLHGNYVAPLVHRFTLLKPGTKQKRASGSPSPSGHAVTENSGWNPLDIIFSSGLLVSKCDLCNKRIAWKPVLECDDCGLRCVYTYWAIDRPRVNLLLGHTSSAGSLRRATVVYEIRAVVYPFMRCRRCPGSARVQRKLRIRLSSRE